MAGLSRRRARLGDPPRSRRARDSGRRGLGLGRRDHAAGRPDPRHPRAVARRRRRLRSARVRSRRQGLRRRRFRRAGGQGPCGLGRRRHAAPVQPPTARGSRRARAMRAPPRLWRRGEPFAAAKIVFEGAADDISVFAGLDRSVEPPRWVFGRRTSFFAYELWLGDAETRAKIDAPADADKDAHGDWLIVQAAVGLDAARKDPPRGGAARRAAQAGARRRGRIHDAVCARRASGARRPRLDRRQAPALAARRPRAGLRTADAERRRLGPAAARRRA